MISQTKWSNGTLMNGLSSLSGWVSDAIGGSSDKLNEHGKKEWRKKFVDSAILSKGKNGREWFSLNKKLWYITNQWKVPDNIWDSKNYLKSKRAQANKDMQKTLSNEKQRLLDRALEIALGKFK